MPKHLRLISHKLCPSVQRAVIVATEKGINFERVDIDLANKPDWFLEISPTGKVPVLEVIDEDGFKHVIFESAVIAEYLDETAPNRLHSSDPLARARERAWVEYASATLGDVHRLYTAPDKAAFDEAAASLRNRAEHLEKEIAGPWFAGERFGLVDAAFGPVFRYFKYLHENAGLQPLRDLPRTIDWAKSLLARRSVAAAVPSDYFERLDQFFKTRGTYLSSLITTKVPEAA